MSVHQLKNFRARPSVPVPAVKNRRSAAVFVRRKFQKLFLKLQTIVSDETNRLSALKTRRVLAIRHEDVV